MSRPYAMGHHYAIGVDELPGATPRCHVCGSGAGLTMCSMCERDFCADGCLLHCATCGWAICDKCQRNHEVLDAAGRCENCQEVAA